MTRLRQTLLRTSGIVVLLIGMVWLGETPAHAQQAITSTHRALVVTDTHQCAHGTPALANFNARLYLAWTGCDAQHHLNIEYSTDGTNWGNKVTLTDTAMDGTGPALVPFNNDLYIAWAGTDSPSHMWIGYFNNSPTLLNHTRLADSTNKSPSMAVYSSRIWLAWTGTDTAHHLNFEGSFDGITFTNKATTTDGSSVGPGIATFNNRLYVGWAGTDTAQRENVAYFNGSTTLQGKVTFSDNAGLGDVGLTVGYGELWEVALSNINSNTNGLRQSPDGSSWTDPGALCTGADLSCAFYGAKIAAFGSCDIVWQAFQSETTLTIWVQC